MRTADALAGQRILIVEDEFFIAVGLANVLQSAGAEVIGPFPSVSQALGGIVSAGRIDGALLDVNLGDEDVDEVAVALRERAVPIVFHTGYGTRKLPPGFEGAEVLDKPASDELLIRTLMRLVGSVSPGDLGQSAGDGGPSTGS